MQSARCLRCVRGGDVHDKNRWKLCGNQRGWQRILLFSWIEYNFSVAFFVSLKVFRSRKRNSFWKNYLPQIQYACQHLGTKFVLVMGHTKCGAIAAASAPRPAGSTSPTSRSSPVNSSRPRLRVNSGDSLNGGTPSLPSEPSEVSVTRLTRTRSQTEALPGQDPLKMLIDWIRRSLENDGEWFGCYPVIDDMDCKNVWVWKHVMLGGVS